MTRLHSLLLRQLARLEIDRTQPPSASQWTAVLERVSCAYQEADQDRYLLERSQDLASAEMTELYRALQDERRQLEERVSERTSAARAREVRISAALFGSNLAFVEVHTSGSVYLSERWNEMLGGEPQPTHTDFESLLALTHEDEREGILREYVEAVTGRKSEYNYEHRVRANDGTWRWVRCRGRVIERDADGRALRLTGINEDITERKEAEARLRHSESRFRSLLALSSDWYWEQDADLRFTEVSGTDPERDWPGIAQLRGRTGTQGPIPMSEADLGRYRSLTAARQPFRDLTLTVRDRDGEWRYLSFSGEPVFDADGTFTGYRGIARDVTQSRRAEERIRRLAHFDELTGLPNRTMFMHTLQRAFSLAQRRSKQFALFIIDLDRFKNINDSLGHEAGDRLLQEVGRRLRHHLRESDTVARLGGDEFVVLVEDCGDARELTAIAQNILAAIGRPYMLSGREFHVTGSVGISTYPVDGQDPPALLKNADIAMYLAKDRGKNTFQFYAAQQNGQAFERLALESALRHALTRREFALHYQPRVDIVTGRMVAVEALLRWNHPDLGTVAPNQFIPLAEETGLIVPIGRWVLRSACAQAAQWRADGLAGMRVAVNLSARQFVDDALIVDVGDALAEAALPPDGLELEITESMVMQSPERAVTTLSRLRELGIAVSIDDFGTGYSSLGYLKRFPIDSVKIDRSFIKDLPHDADDAAITRAVIAMARSLRIRVVAEGVETREQLDFLRTHECDECQGFFLSRPLPAPELATLARGWAREHAGLRLVPKLTSVA